MNKPRKVPMRKCIATGDMKPKKELVRIVRSNEGDVSIDPTGKKSGRGAYLSKDKEAVLKARKKNILENHLQVSIEETLYDDLLDLIEKEKRLSK